MAQAGRRQAWIAAVLSFLAPGLGQIYNLRWERGITFLLGFAGTDLALLFSSALRHPSGLAFGILLRLSLSVWASSDAYRQEPRRPDWEPPAMLWRLWAVLLAVLALAGLGFLEIRSLKIRAYKMPTESMSPTIQPGDHFIVDMGYYQFHGVEDKDIIVLAETDSLLVKRIMASPGETIQGEREHVSLNGKPMDEPYAIYISHGTRSPNFGPLTLPAERYFVLGDNRDHSWDSRYPEFPPVRREDIKGKVLYIYWSKKLSRIGQSVR